MPTTRAENFVHQAATQFPPSVVARSLSLVAACLMWPSTAFASSAATRAEKLLSGLQASLGLDTRSIGSSLGLREFGDGLWQFGLDSSMYYQHSGGGGHRRCGVGVEDVAIVAVVGAIVVTLLRTRRASARQRLDLARAMMERGMEPPAELLARPGNDLQRGIVLVFAGVGLLLASYVSRGAELSPAGLVPCFVGIGYLLSHRFATKSES